MTDYFGGFPVAAFTRHFAVTYAAENDADAFSRAQAILGSCELDLQRLQDWFACNYDDSPYTIWVHVEAGVVGGGASNYGYDDDESSRIFVTGTYKPAAGDAAGFAIRDDLARMLFVAELAEILMDFTGRGWNRGDSAGEALSRVAAAELHPNGYYGSGDGPIVGKWLQSVQDNFVSGSEGTDNNPLSYGCGILFLNYLAYQLGIPISKIVQAGGSSLAETFSRVTGQPGPGAFGQFQAVLKSHIQQPKYFAPARDNIFPLYDDARVGFMVNPQELAPSRRADSLHIVLKAGPICPEKDYTYHIVDVPIWMTVKAVTRGFASARFEWTLGGLALPIHGLSENVAVNINVTDTTPGKDVPFKASLPIRYLIQDNGNTSTLQFWNTDFPGNADVDVGVVATEAQATTIKSALTENWPLNMRRFLMDPPWSSDVRTCNPRFVDLDMAIAKLGHRIFVLKNSPDPPPDQLAALAAEAERYGALLKEVGGNSVGLERAVLEGAVSLRAASAPPAIAERAGVPGGLPTRVANARRPQPQTREPNTDDPT